MSPRPRHNDDDDRKPHPLFPQQPAAGAGDVFEWKEPPRSAMNGAKARIEEKFRYLQQHPGRWALIAVNASNGAAEPYRRRGCQTSVRATTAAHNGGAPRYDVYARWPK